MNDTQSRIFVEVEESSGNTIDDFVTRIPEQRAMVQLRICVLCISLDVLENQRISKISGLLVFSTNQRGGCQGFY